MFETKPDPKVNSTGLAFFICDVRTRRTVKRGRTHACCRISAQLIAVTGCAATVVGARDIGTGGDTSRQARHTNTIMRTLCTLVTV